MKRTTQLLLVATFALLAVGLAASAASACEQGCTVQSQSLERVDFSVAETTNSVGTECKGLEECGYESIGTFGASSLAGTSNQVSTECKGLEEYGYESIGTFGASSLAETSDSVGTECKGLEECGYE